jgi:hypothetical protein
MGREYLLKKYRRLVKMTPAVCLAAITEWLRTERELQASETSIRIIENKIWVEFLGLTYITPYDDDVENDTIPALRGILWPYFVQDMQSGLTSEVLVVHLHDFNPTPLVTRELNVTITERRSCWGRVALFPTPEIVEARSVTGIFEPWGSLYQWPFSDSK